MERLWICLPSPSLSQWSVVISLGPPRGNSVHTLGEAKLNIRISSILFSLAAACALIAYAWYQSHGGPAVFSKFGLIFVMMTVLSLARALHALIGCAFARRSFP